MSIEKINVLECVIKVSGRIFWNDGRRRIDLKKPIRDIFEPLENKQYRMTYNMEFCLSKSRLIRRTEELSEKGVIPVLLYFLKEDVQDAE